MHFRTSGPGEFLTFDTLTLTPIQSKLILPELLTKEELEWLNEYHEKCRSWSPAQLFSFYPTLFLDAYPAPSTPKSEFSPGVLRGFLVLTEVFADSVMKVLLFTEEMSYFFEIKRCRLFETRARFSSCEFFAIIKKDGFTFCG